MVDISGSYGKLKRWVNRKIAAIVLSSLADVDDTNIGNDKILQYKTATEKHEYVDPPSGYTDADAIAAVLADDAYLKRLGDTLDGDLHASAAGKYFVPQNTIGMWFDQPTGRCLFHNHGDIGRADIGFGGSSGATMEFYSKYHATREGQYKFVYGGGNYGKMSFVHYDGSSWNDVFYCYKHDHIKSYVDFYMSNKIIIDMKNHAATALSGTKKLIEIKIGSTPYYFEVYPTKA